MLRDYVRALKGNAVKDFSRRKIRNLRDSSRRRRNLGARKSPQTSHSAKNPSRRCLKGHTSKARGNAPERGSRPSGQWRKRRRGGVSRGVAPRCGSPRPSGRNPKLDALPLRRCGRADHRRVLVDRATQRPTRGVTARQNAQLAALMARDYARLVDESARLGAELIKQTERHYLQLREERAKHTQLRSQAAEFRELSGWSASHRHNRHLPAGHKASWATGVGSPRSTRVTPWNLAVAGRRFACRLFRLSGHPDE